MSSLTIEALLGGKEVIGQAIHTEMDLYELGKGGIPKKALLDLADQTNMSLKALSSILQISERTLQRKKDSDLLNRSVSEQVIQLAQVFSRGNEVFNSVEDFQTWIETANKALGNKRPEELLSSRYGAQMILDELGRIEHGVFS
jgi:putative toxin-antitoxin system antitoxin component (TIGR02293 family)